MKCYTKCHASRVFYGDVENVGDLPDISAEVLYCVLSSNCEENKKNGCAFSALLYTDGESR